MNVISNVMDELVGLTAELEADLKSQTAAAQLHSTGIYTGEVLQPPRPGGSLSSILDSPGRFQDVCRRRANN